MDPRLDAEVIHLAACFFEALGLTDLHVHLNSMGDGEDRDRWREAVRAFLAPTIDQHCELCRERFKRNVLRVLDCKNPECRNLNANAPRMVDYLSPANKRDFHAVQEVLQKSLGRKVTFDPGIVRGLDYYTRTVFEIHAPKLGARSALCGGGRYDHLIRDLGGPDLGAVGFAVGFTSTLVLLREQGLLADRAEEPAHVFLVLVGEGGQDVGRWQFERTVFELAEELRRQEISCVYDVEQRSLKAQMKQAGKGGHPFAVVLGPDEIASGKVQLKDLETGEQHEIARSALPSELRARLAARDRSLR
jgi:histidyl-tRNA synthetase